MVRATDFLNSNGTTAFSLVSSTTTIQQAFIVKYNSLGVNHLHFKELESNSSNPIVPGQMDLDGNGSVYVGGTLWTLICMFR